MNETTHCEHCKAEAEYRASKAAGTVDEHYAAIVAGRTETSPALDHTSGGAS